MKHFKEHIYSGRLATLPECRRAQMMEEPVLNGRSIQKIKDFVRNYGISLQRKMAAKGYLIKDGALHPQLSNSNSTNVQSPQAANTSVSSELSSQTVKPPSSGVVTSPGTDVMTSVKLPSQTTNTTAATITLPPQANTSTTTTLPPQASSASATTLPSWANINTTTTATTQHLQANTATNTTETLTHQANNASTVLLLQTYPLKQILLVLQHKSLKQITLLVLLLLHYPLKQFLLLPQLLPPVRANTTSTTTTLPLEQMLLQHYYPVKQIPLLLLQL